MSQSKLAYLGSFPTCILVSCVILNFIKIHADRESGGRQIKPVNICETNL